MSRTRRTLPRVGRQEEIQGVCEADARRKLFIIQTDQAEREYERHARSLRSRLRRREKHRVPLLSGPPDAYYFGFDKHDVCGCDAEYYDDPLYILMELVPDAEGVALVVWDEDPESNERMHALFYGVASSGSLL